LTEIEKEISEFNPSQENLWFAGLKTAIRRGTVQNQDDESKLGSYEGFAQVTDVMLIDSVPAEYESKALKYAIKSIQGLPNFELLIAKYRKQFDICTAEYEQKMNLIQLSLKTQVEIQIGLILSGLPEFRNN
jgi:hypothetical protein